MKKFISLLFFGLFGMITWAQTSEVDSVSNGSYYVEFDPKIDSLVQKKITSTCTKKKLAAQAEKAREKEANLDPCAKSTKVMGYKIQILYTKDRTNAQNAVQLFGQEFPHLSPEMVYTQPDYRVMAGDYFTKRSAAADLQSVRKKYPGAFLVKWRVWCRKAK